MRLTAQRSMRAGNLMLLEYWTVYRLTGAILLAALSLFGQQPLTVAEAVQSAVGSHPLLAAARSRIEVARGNLRQSGLRPNPTLILQSENIRTGSTSSPFVFPRDTDDFAYVQQRIETGGKRARRMDAASLELRRMEAEAEVVRRQVAARVKAAYWAAAGAERVHLLLHETQLTFKQVVDYHEIRVKEGAMAEADLLRVRFEADRIALSATQAGLDAARARIALLREMGRTAFPDIQFSDAIELKEDRLILADADRAVDQRPEVSSARVHLDEARAGLNLQHAQGKTNYELFGGYKRATGYNTLIAGLQWELPLWNRNQGNIESAASRIKEAEANLAATEAVVRAEVTAAQAEYETRRRQVLEFLGKFREQANESSRIAQAAYRLGGADLLRLLDAERLRLETEVLALQSMTEYRRSIVALETSLGVEP